jgi:hypothetical protein
MIEDSIVERLVLRQSTSMQSLQKGEKEGLFREKPSSLLHSGHGPCHQSQTVRKRNAGACQIRPSRYGNLL